MSFRSFVRGDNAVDTDEVKAVLCERYSFDDVGIEPVDGDNWLSVPLVVDSEYFVKVVTPQNTLTHSFFTGLRNLGVRMSGSGPFFETYDSPAEMARHELESARRMKEAGVRCPRPVEVLETGDNAVIVFEYLDDFAPLSEARLTDDVLHDVFASLRRLHDNGLAHGDFSLENVLVVGEDSEVYFIDATRIKDGDEAVKDAIAYDLACALGALSSHDASADEERIIDAASSFYGRDELERALDFLVVARLRPGIESGFSVLRLRQAVNS